jgi:DNA (cytosine-5)-methyltransferase 1
MQMLDLFSGIGGFHRGFEEAGWEFDWVGFSEVDKHASSVYRHRYPEAVELGDIKLIQPERDLPDKLTVLCGGFPCQSFSIAGKRDIRDARGTLFFEIARILSYYRDKGDPVPYFLLENVKGLYSHDDYTTFAKIYGVLADLDYNVECSLENTKYYLPQNRERVYIAGYIGDRGRGQIFPIRKGDATDGSKQEKGDVVTCIDASYYKGVDGKRTMIADYRTDEGLRIRKDNVSPCLNSVKSSETEPSWMPPLAIEKSYGVKALDETLAKNDLKADDVKALDLYNRKAQDISPTLTEPHHNSLRLYENSRIRRLTPNECERLQGFSARNEDGTWEDGWTSKGMVDGKVVNISDTQRYRMCGNAVTVNVVRAIAAKMLSTVETDCEHENLEQGEDRYGREDHEYITYWFCLDCGEEIE